MTLAEIRHRQRAVRRIPRQSALYAYRNPPVEELLEVEPQIGEPILAGQNADFMADYIYCNSLSAKGSLLLNGSPVGAGVPLAATVFCDLNISPNMGPSGNQAQFNIGTGFTAVPINPAYYILDSTPGNNRILVVQAGMYLVTGEVRYQDGQGGTLRAFYIWSSWDNYQYWQPYTIWGCSIGFSNIIPLNAGQSIAFAGSADQNNVVGPNTPGIAITRMGPKS